MSYKSLNYIFWGVGGKQVSRDAKRSVAKSTKPLSNCAYAKIA